MYKRQSLNIDEEMQYNAGMMIHPVFYGYQITPLRCTDPQFVSPVFFNCYLKMGDDAEDDLKQPFSGKQGHSGNWIPVPGPPADLATNGCPICFSGDVAGCPSCWGFPNVLDELRGVRLASRHNCCNWLRTRFSEGRVPLLTAPRL